MKNDKIKKEILEEFKEEFGIHFQSSTGELQFVQEFISEAIDRIREEERQNIGEAIERLYERNGNDIEIFVNDMLNYKEILKQSLAPAND